jgi:hypothetical protein
MLRFEMNRSSSKFVMTIISGLSILYFTNCSAAFSVPNYGGNELIDGMMQGQQFFYNNRMNAQKVRAAELQNQLMQQELNERRQIERQTNYEKIILISLDKKNNFLGCMSCSPHKKDSIHNVNGPFTNKNKKNSIFNSQGPYGSSYSDFSACNVNATHPPLMTNDEGHIYGLITLNTKLDGAIREPIILKWLKKVCKK